MLEKRPSRESVRALQLVRTAVLNIIRVCYKTRVSDASSSKTPLDANAPAYTPTTSSTLYTESDHTVLLQTAQATIYNPCRPHISDKIRVVLDCGSQQSYITDVVKRKLSLRPEGRRDTAILTFGSRRERVHSCDIVKVGVCTISGDHMELKLLSVP